MHIFKVPEITDPNIKNLFDPGSYLLEDRNGAEIMMGQPTLRATMTEWENTYQAEDPKSILVIGTAGFGDSFLLTPVLRELKRLYPEASIRISCPQLYRQVFFGLKYVDGYAPYPMPVGFLKDVDRVYVLEHAVQFNEFAKIEHMTDRFAHHFGLKTLANKKPDYHLSSEEIRWVTKTFPRNTRKRLAVQVQAGVFCRTYPAWIPKRSELKPGTNEQDPRLQQVIMDMVKDGWEVSMMGIPNDYHATNYPNVHNIAQLGLSFRQSVAYLTTCDAFLGPDSSLLHAAGALDIPAVGLFGPYPWKLRTAYYESVFSIQGKEGCDMAPCFHVAWPGMPKFPFEGPCARTGVCVPLASITPDRIVTAINKVFTEKPRSGAALVLAPTPGEVAALK